MSSSAKSASESLTPGIRPLCPVSVGVWGRGRCAGAAATAGGGGRTGDNGHKARYQLWLITMAVAVGLLVLFAATRVEVDILVDIV
eukprot:COSAG02_NODE_10791_length_1857_cov_8.522495_2_plen_86_part_00